MNFGTGFSHARDMRILLVSGIYPPEIGGPATVAPLLAQACHVRGWTTRVVTYGDAATDRTGAWEVRVVSKQSNPLVRYARLFWHVWQLARVSDVVFLQGTFVEGLPGLLGAKLAGRPAVVRMPGCFSLDRWQMRTNTLISIEDFLTPRTLRPFWVSLLSQIEGWVTRSVKRVFLPSRYFLPLLAMWRVDPSKVRVIYNLPEPQPVTKTTEELRRQFCLPLNKRVFLTLARGIQTKRVDFLIDLLPQLPDAVLVALGEGDMYAAWRERAYQKGVAERFITPGRVDRSCVFEYAKASDAFLLASHTENYPFAAIEMVLAGLPCFLSDRGGNLEAAEQFPGRIRILPYACEIAWVEVLREMLPERQIVTPNSPSHMVDQYLDEIEVLMRP